MRKPNKLNGTRVIACTCQHKQQDAMYGKGMRLHNRVDGKGKPIGYACTVCTPRRTPAERNTVAIPQKPAFGMKVSVPAQPVRKLKSL